MPEWSKWNPIQIPDAFRQYSDKTETSGDPMDAWDASDWKDPDAQGWKQRLVPSHTGQWLIVGAGGFLFMGFVLWVTQFFPLTHANPWTLVAFAWPASLLIKHVTAREAGFNATQQLDWTFITTGRSIKVLPGKFVERFGEGDIQHVAFTPLKSRSYGGYKFNYLKLGDLGQSREWLVSKASGSNRGPDSDARILLPGALTGENADTVLGRVFGVHGGSIKPLDSGSGTDLRVTAPSTLDDDVAADVLSQLEMYDQRIIPELKNEINTIQTQKERYKHRAEAERDPELDRLLGSVATMADLLNNRRSGDRSSGDDEVDEIDKRAREYVEGGN